MRPPSCGRIAQGHTCCASASPAKGGSGCPSRRSWASADPSTWVARSWSRACVIGRAGRSASTQRPSSSDPTQLRLKVWAAGDAEPDKWQLVRNDKRRDIGVEGLAGLGATNTKGSTKRKAAIAFDDVKISQAADTTRIAKAKRIAKADTQKPRILEIGATTVTMRASEIRWTLDEPATGVVKFGTTKSYGRWTTREDDYLKTHVQRIGGLEPGTTYHYAVVSKDKAGNRKVSTDHTFQTKAAPEPAPKPSPRPRLRRPRPRPSPRPRPNRRPVTR